MARSFEKVDMGDGWSEIKSGLVVENNSDTWARIMLAAGKLQVRTAQGYEYACTGYMTTLGYDLPPGIRTLGDRNGQPIEVTCRVASATSGYELTVPYHLSVWKSGVGFYEKTEEIWPKASLHVALENVDPDLAFPFAKPGGRAAYCRRPPEGIRCLAPGEVLETDFGSISFDRLRLLPEEAGDSPRFEVGVTVRNQDGGYDLSLQPTGMLHTTEGLQAGVVATWNCQPRAGPLQTVQTCLRSQYELNERLTMPDGACLSLQGIPYLIGENPAKGMTDHRPVLVCFGVLK